MFFQAEAMLRDSLKWRTESKIDSLRCEDVESQIVMGRIANIICVFYFTLPLLSTLFA